MTHAFQVTFDAIDPAALAAFWAEALGYVLQPPPEGFENWDSFADSIGIPEEDRDKLAAIVDPSGDGPRVLFQKVPEVKTAKNRVHLDVDHTSTRDLGDAASPQDRRAAINEETDRLAGLGATWVADFDEPTGVWTVMLDPEGNEFCVQ